MDGQSHEEVLSKAVRVVRTKSRMVAAQGRREGDRNRRFVGTVSAVHDEKVLEKDGGDRCDHGHVLNTTELYAGTSLRW